jgi:FAD/FMN-containing dehydrogenase
MLNPADPAFLAQLEGQLAPGALRAPAPRDLEEPRGRWQGRAGAVALPRTVEEVAVIMRACAAARVGIVPMGGGTGLVGGQILADGPLPLIVSLERMAALRGIWPQENAMTVEAGMILATAHDHAAGVGRVFPLTLASEGSARIGGLLSTNAGGVNVLRYGNARDLVLGVEAVLPDGSILHGLKRLRKDNTGYDLRHLLIGAEGTLGIITAASLRLFPAPASTATALLDVADPATALRLLELANTHAAGLISAFELIHRQGLDFLSETLPDVAQPFRPQSDWMVLLELALPAGLGGAEAVMAGVLEAAFEAGLARDGAVAASDSQRKAIWSLRESIPLANRKVGAISSHDISLPLTAISDFILQANALLAAMGDFRVNCFGHLGDGNLHYNVFPARGRTKTDYLDQRETVKDTVHDLVNRMGGSVSAEHGIGRLKVGDLVHYGDPAKLAAMRALKAALDPLGIMNPGAVIGGR